MPDAKTDSSAAGPTDLEASLRATALQLQRLGMRTDHPYPLIETTSDFNSTAESALTIRSIVMSNGRQTRTVQALLDHYQSGGNQNTVLLATLEPLSDGWVPLERVDRLTPDDNFTEWYLERMVSAFEGFPKAIANANAALDVSAPQTAAKIRDSQYWWMDQLDKRAPLLGIDPAAFALDPNSEAFSGRLQTAITGTLVAEAQLLRSIGMRPNVIYPVPGNTDMYLTIGDVPYTNGVDRQVLPTLILHDVSTWHAGTGKWAVTTFDRLGRDWLIDYRQPGGNDVTSINVSGTEHKGRAFTVLYAAEQLPSIVATVNRKCDEVPLSDAADRQNRLNHVAQLAHRLGDISSTDTQLS